MENLTREEIIYLYSLVETSKRGLLPMDYHFGNYREASVCINKDNNIWQVYLCERGNKFEIETFEDIKNACIKVIWHCSYDKVEMESGTQYFLMEVIKGYSLSENQINEFKDNYLDEIHTNRKKKVREK